MGRYGRGGGQVRVRVRAWVRAWVRACVRAWVRVRVARARYECARAGAHLRGYVWVYG